MQQVLDHGGISLIEYMGGDDTVVKAARVSIEAGKRGQGKTAEDDAKLIAYLAKNGHTSPFEHCFATFYVKCPFFVRSQWHRHRTQSYNEVSGRYSTTVFTEFYLPSVERLMTVGSKDSRQGGSAVDTEEQAVMAQHGIRIACEEAFSSYRRLLENGVAPELARGILPQNTYTEYYASASLWNWTRFLRERMANGAQWEIRQYAEFIFNQLNLIYPVSTPALMCLGGK